LLKQDWRSTGWSCISFSAVAIHGCHGSRPCVDWLQALHSLIPRLRMLGILQSQSAFHRGLGCWGTWEKNMAKSWHHGFLYVSMDIWSMVDRLFCGFDPLWSISGTVGEALYSTSSCVALANLKCQRTK
jgi:hypothetical protein